VKTATKVRDFQLFSVGKEQIVHLVALFDNDTMSSKYGEKNVKNEAKLLKIVEMSSFLQNSP